MDFTPLSCPCEAKCFRNTFRLYCRLSSSNTLIVCKACGRNLKFGDRKRDRTRIINSAYFARDLCYFCGHDQFSYALMYECPPSPGSYSLKAYTPNASPLLNPGEVTAGLTGGRHCKITLYLMCSRRNRCCYNIQCFSSLQEAVDKRSQCAECRSGTTLEPATCDGMPDAGADICSGCRAHIFCRCHDNNQTYLQYRAAIYKVNG